MSFTIRIPFTNKRFILRGRRFIRIIDIALYTYESGRLVDTIYRGFTHRLEEEDQYFFVLTTIVAIEFPEHFY